MIILKWKQACKQAVWVVHAFGWFLHFCRPFFVCISFGAWFQKVHSCRCRTWFFSCRWFCFGMLRFFVWWCFWRETPSFRYFLLFCADGVFTGCYWLELLPSVVGNSGRGLKKLMFGEHAKFKDAQVNFNSNSWKTMMRAIFRITRMVME